VRTVVVVTPPRPEKRKWGFGEWTGVITLVITVLGVVVAIATPETRRFFRLDPSQDPEVRKPEIVPPVAKPPDVNPNHDKSPVQPTLPIKKRPIRH